MNVSTEKYKQDVQDDNYLILCATIFCFEFFFVDFHFYSTLSPDFSQSPTVPVPVTATVFEASFVNKSLYIYV